LPNFALSQFFFPPNPINLVPNMAPGRPPLPRPLPPSPLDPLTPAEIGEATSLARLALEPAFKLHFASCEAVEPSKDDIALVRAILNS
jgi:Cu2+-containing amine oxidase